MSDALLIGYGNDLRTDDGAGRWVAEAVEALALPGLRVYSTAQLTPELALEMAGKQLVVFVDASVRDREVIVRELQPPAEPAQRWTHHGDPAALLALVGSVGPLPGVVYVVTVPAHDLELGTTLTPAARASAARAVERVTELVGSHRRRQDG